MSKKIEYNCKTSLEQWGGGGRGEGRRGGGFELKLFLVVKQSFL